MVLTMKPKEKAHDEAPAIVTDHPFEPRGEWWSLCKYCGLAMPAHAETTVNPDDHLAPRVQIEYYSDEEDE